MNIGGGTAVAVARLRDWHRETGLSCRRLLREFHKHLPPALHAFLYKPVPVPKTHSQRLNATKLSNFAKWPKPQIAHYAILLQTRKRHEKSILESLASFAVCKLLHNMSCNKQSSQTYKLIELSYSQTAGIRFVTSNLPRGS